MAAGSLDKLMYMLDGFGPFSPLGVYTQASMAVAEVQGLAPYVEFLQAFGTRWSAGSGAHVEFLQTFGARCLHET